jgi:ABC-type branched-subunit amino acid transport system ATPase component
MTALAAPILSVTDLEVSYGPTQVIFGVSLDVPEGGLCCLMGRNGVGKSTLLQTIVGLQPAQAGSIALGAETITKRAPYDRVKAGIAYVPQGREAFPYLTVLKTSGMSILLVEQYVDFAMRLADTYAVMDVGRIVAAGPTETFERARVQQLMSV